jgi:hypothetical protein
MFHESLAATTDLGVLPGVLGCRILRRTVQVRLGTNPAVPRDELPGGTPICVISRQQFTKYPGWPGYLPPHIEVRYAHTEEKKSNRNYFSL